METQPPPQLLMMLAALADENRLTLLRLLHQSEHNVGDLARRLNLSEPTISHHLTRLREAGLVSVQAAGNQRLYRIDPAGLAAFKQLAGRIEQTPHASAEAVPDEEWIATLGWDAEDQKVLREYIQYRQLTHLPSKQKKLIVILRWLATLFEPGKMYTEAEVNTTIKAVYAEDYVGLRRDLIDFGYLRRERGGGKYWLAPAAEEESNLG